MDSGNSVVSNPGLTDVASYGPATYPPTPAPTTPLVLDSVSAPDTRNTADFQVNPLGNDAVFTSTLPLTGYDNAAHPEIFRYDALSDTLECASCNPTGEQATGDATLASNGLSLTDDGRVFFNSTEGLVDRDLNEKMDVYEWSPQKQESEIVACHTTGGCIELISTGTNALDSSLLGARRWHRCLFLHPRYSGLLRPERHQVKIYDARSLGGFVRCRRRIRARPPMSATGPVADPDAT